MRYELLIQQYGNSVYSDDFYPKYKTNVPKFNNLQKAINWVNNHEKKLLSLCDLSELNYVDCLIEEWENDDYSVVEYHNLFTKEGLC